MVIMNQIVEELKARRIEAGLSLLQLAIRMHTVPARLSEIENGRGGLTLKRMYDWAEALGLKVTIKFEEK